MEEEGILNSSATKSRMNMARRNAMMIASVHSRTAERTPPLGAGEVVPEDPEAFAAGRGAEGFVAFAMPGLSGQPVCQFASLPVRQFVVRGLAR